MSRFTQPDTVVPNPANPQNVNRYSYVRNKPVRFSDPSGHETCYTDGRGCFESAEHAGIDAGGGLIAFNDGGAPRIDLDFGALAPAAASAGFNLTGRELSELAERDAREAMESYARQIAKDAGDGIPYRWLSSAEFLKQSKLSAARIIGVTAKGLVVAGVVVDGIVVVSVFASDAPLSEKVNEAGRRTTSAALVAGGLYLSEACGPGFIVCATVIVGGTVLGPLFWDTSVLAVQEAGAIAADIASGSGAPASFCQGGGFDRAQAEAMGFHHESGASCGGG